MENLRFLTGVQLASILGLSLPTVYAHLRSGRLPGRKLGRRWLVSEGALERFLTPAPADNWFAVGRSTISRPAWAQSGSAVSL